MSTPTLYNLTEEQEILTAKVEEILYENGGEETEEVTALLDELAGTESSIIEKLDKYGYYIRAAQADAAALDGKAKEIDAHTKLIKNRAKAKKRHIELMKMRALWALDVLGKTEIETPSLFRFVKTINSGRVLEMNEDVDFADIPAHFFRHSLSTLDKTHVKRMIEDGVEIDFAHLAPQGFHLRFS